MSLRSSKPSGGSTEGTRFDFLWALLTGRKLAVVAVGVPGLGMIGFALLKRCQSRSSVGAAEATERSIAPDFANYPAQNSSIFG